MTAAVSRQTPATWTDDRRRTAKGDGKLRCFRCNERHAPQLMHRVVFDKLQDQAARAKRDRDTKPVWWCNRCWRRKFAVAGGA